MTHRATGLSTQPHTGRRCAGRFQPERRACTKDAETLIGPLPFCLRHGALALADSLAEWLTRAGMKEVQRDT